LINARGLREEIVLATKAGFSAAKGVSGGGSGARRLYSALNGSLRRLQTDYVDLYWLHVWDSLTPAEELLETMTSLVRAGKIRYWGMSNSPAWYVAKVATLAASRGMPGPIALQYFYSLANRDIEDEHVPLAAEFDMAIQPWSPLAYGLLTGKYHRAAVEAASPRSGGLPRDAREPGEERARDDKRLDGANPFGDTLFTARNWKIVDELRRVAAEVGATPAQIALSWVMNRPGIAATLMGVSRAAQVAENMAALAIHLLPEHRAALDAVSAPETRMLYTLFTPGMRQHAIFGGASVGAWRG
jgi:aryl-alcohol dehydrogenase-like predicted oxidoreductase